MMDWAALAPTDYATRILRRPQRRICWNTARDRAGFQPVTDHDNRLCSEPGSTMTRTHTDFAAGSDDDAVVVVMMRGSDALLTTQVAII